MEKAVQGVEDCPLAGLPEKHEHLLALISWRLFPRKSLLQQANLLRLKVYGFHLIYLELVQMVDYMGGQLKPLRLPGAHCCWTGMMIEGYIFG